jgi:hypothetical protein
MSSSRRTTGDNVPVGEFGPMGNDRRVWDAQCDYATPVLV